MLNFREITLADREPINRLLSGAGERGGEYSFANLYIWGEQKIADGLPVILSRFGQNYSYLYPYYDPSLIPLLRDDAHERGIRFRLFGLTSAEAEQFADEGSFTVRPVRDSFDYVYDIHRLAELRGKKLQAKRNHCNHFTEQYPDYRVLPLTAELLPAAAHSQSFGMKSIWRMIPLRIFPTNVPRLKRPLTTLTRWKWKALYWRRTAASLLFPWATESGTMFLT